MQSKKNSIRDITARANAVQSIINTHSTFFDLPERKAVTDALHLQLSKSVTRKEISELKEKIDDIEPLARDIGALWEKEQLWQSRLEKMVIPPAAPGNGGISGFFRLKK